MFRLHAVVVVCLLPSLLKQIDFLGNFVPGYHFKLSTQAAWFMIFLLNYGVNDLWVLKRRKATNNSMLTKNLS